MKGGEWRMESLMVSSHTLTGERVAVQAIPTFEEIFSRYNTQIYNYLLGMVGNPEQAQDLTQDTFVKAYRALPRVKELILPAWLYRIATNTALDALRHRKLIAWLPFQPGDDAPRQCRGHGSIISCRTPRSLS